MIYELALICFAFFTSVGASEIAALNARSPLGSDGTIKMAAFNVRIFGRTKMQNMLVADSLIKIIGRCHLILIQEIRDSKGTAVTDLMNRVNNQYDNKYSLKISARLGRSSSKEQYGYIYRKDIFTVLTSYVYNDINDVFEREPFVVVMRSPYLNFDLALIGIHTSPDDAQVEISELKDVYDDAKSRLKIDNIMLLGDFNGACKYVRDWSQVKLAQKGAGLYWLITDATDTTSGSTNCAYDRIVVSGNQLISSVDPFSPDAFHYDTYFGLNSEQALEVSDHYPVEVSLRPSKEIKNAKLTNVYMIRDQSLPSVEKKTAYAIKNLAEAKGTFQVSSLFSKTGAYSSIRVTLTPKGAANALKALHEMSSLFSNAISALQSGIAVRHIKRLDKSTLFPKSANYDTLGSYYQSFTTNYILTLVFRTNTVPCETWLEVGSIP